MTYDSGILLLITWITINRLSIVIAWADDNGESSDKDYGDESEDNDDWW